MIAGHVRVLSVLVRLAAGCMLRVGGIRMMQGAGRGYSVVVYYTGGIWARDYVVCSLARLLH